MRETKERGITLIALIITVIVMLILAGVAINLTVGDNGIFKKSSEGAQIYKNAAANEATSLNSMDAEMEELMANINKEFRIYTKADLMEFATRVNNGESFAGYQVYLENDIDLSEGGQENWIGIGVQMPREGIDYSFEGIFEGQNHTISNLYINEAGTYNGLFRDNKGVIRDLNVEGRIEYETDWWYYTGGIAGTNSGSIENCLAQVNMTLEGTHSTYEATVGAIIGDNWGTIKNCKSSGSITIGWGTQNLGGIAGQNGGSVQGCVNECNLERGGGTNSRIGCSGGIVGRNVGTVLECVNKGNVYGGSGRSWRNLWFNFS